jgi:hypothetical protein
MTVGMFGALRRHKCETLLGEGRALLQQGKAREAWFALDAAETLALALGDGELLARAAALLGDSLAATGSRSAANAMWRNGMLALSQLGERAPEIVVERLTARLVAWVEGEHGVDGERVSAQAVMALAWEERVSELRAAGQIKRARAARDEATRAWERAYGADSPEALVSRASVIETG